MQSNLYGEEEFQEFIELVSTNYFDFADDLLDNSVDEESESEDYKKQRELVKAYKYYKREYNNFFSQTEDRFTDDLIRTNHYNYIISRLYTMKDNYVMALLTELVQEQRSLSSSKTKFGFFLDEKKQYAFFIYLEGYNSPMIVHLKDIDFYKRNIDYYGDIPFYEKSPFGKELSSSILKKCDDTLIKVKKEDVSVIRRKIFSGKELTPDEISILLSKGKYPFPTAIKLLEHCNSQGDDLHSL